MIFKGPGGHSFFRIRIAERDPCHGPRGCKISRISDAVDPRLPLRSAPAGGTSVNAIAGEARMAVDMRSDSTRELLKLEARLLDLASSSGGRKTRAGNPTR